MRPMPATKTILVVDDEPAIVQLACDYLEHAGFAVVGVFARPDGTPFEPAVSSAMWIVGQRCAVEDSRPPSAPASSS